jgi:DNA-binding response OmpR family regulator
MAKKILLIEDEKILAEMYEERLKREGFEVIRSVDAEGGFAIAKEEKPDLIILDIILPDADMDGTDLLKKFKEDKDTKDIPVILFSNYDTPEVRAIAKKHNTRYILKASVTTKDLVEAIKKELKMD